MKYTTVLKLLFSALVPFISPAGPFSLPFAALAQSSPAVISSDQQFLQALAAHNVPTVEGLLNPNFIWIDSRGQRLDKTEVLKALPAAANAEVPAEQHIYGKTAVIRADRGQIHVMRVWLQQRNGWQLVLYQEVTQVEKSEPAGGTVSSECVNPCKEIPLTAQTPSEREAIASWQRVMTAMAENDAGAYSPLIADEFTATDTHHDRPYTKTDRLVQIAKQKSSGTHSAPPELLSGEIFDFGETVLMIAREQRKQAKAYFNSRMWVKRDDRWQMLFSFNTRIE